MTEQEYKEKVWRGVLNLFICEVIIWTYILIAYHHKLTTFQSGLFLYSFVIITLATVTVNKGFGAGTAGMILATVFPLAQTFATGIPHKPSPHNPAETLETLKGLLLGAAAAPFILTYIFGYYKMDVVKNRSAYNVEEP